MYIYGEEFIAFNLAANFIIVFGVSLNIHVNKKTIRAFMTSLIGTFFSFLLVNYPNVCCGFALKLFVSLVMCILLNVPNFSVKTILFTLIMLIVSSTVCSGCVMLFSSDTNNTLSTNGVYLYSFSYLKVFAGIAVGFLLNINILRFVKKFFACESETIKCSLFCGDKSLKDIRLLTDSGNLATDNMGNPLIFLSAKCFEQLTGLEGEAFGGYSDYLEYCLTLPQSIQRRISLKQITTLTSRDYRLLYKADLLVFDDSREVKYPVVTYSAHLPEQKYSGICNPRKLIERS